MAEKRPSYTDTYLAKIESCQLAVSSIGVSLSKVLQRYDGACFPDSKIEKSSAFAQVMDGSLTRSAKKYFDEKCGLIHLMDNRDPYEYATDLVLGWIIEDSILIHLSSHGLSPALEGYDRYREFLTPQKISTQPDIRIKTKSGTRLLEIFADWKGTWRKQNHADLRDNKFGKLRKECALMLGIAPRTVEGFLFDFSVNDCGFFENYIPAYSKKGFTKKGVRDDLVPFEEAVARLATICAS